VRSFKREQLQKRMNLCRKVEGTGRRKKALDTTQDPTPAAAAWAGAVRLQINL
jgi:hypothetical protein